MKKLVHKEITSCVNCPYRRILPEKIICALSTEYNPVLHDARTIPAWCPLPDAEYIKPYPASAGSDPLVAQAPRDVSELASRAFNSLLYNELLYAVAQAFPGESRHQTALRYIREREERVGEVGSCKQNIRE